MNEQTAFADALEAAERLDSEEQEELVAILSRRLAERGRQRVAATVEQARREFAAGKWPPHVRVRDSSRGTLVRCALLQSPAFARDLNPIVCQIVRT